MQFALLGNHPDGVAAAAALAATGRHCLAACSARLPEELLRHFNPPPRRIGDVEEILADPSTLAAIVAGNPSTKSMQLRRALQAERHVLCVCPIDQTPDLAYEAAMLQQDAGCVLLPLLPEMLHPAVRRLRELLVRDTPEKPGKNDAVEPATPGAAIGAFRLLTVERAAAQEVLQGFDVAGQKPAFPGWDVFRALGGEIAELSAFALSEEMEPGADVLLAGRFERGGLFQATLLPNRSHAEWRLTLVGNRGRAELYFPRGSGGPAFLNTRGPDGQLWEEAWEAWDPWPALAEQFETALAGRADQLRLSWQDAVRCLELDDAARRSIMRRRSGLLEYQEASEEVGFKGTMTLVGCSVLLICLVLLVLSAWLPLAKWLIIPMLAVFLLLQSLRMFASGGPDKETRRPPHQ